MDDRMAQIAGQVFAREERAIRDVDVFLCFYNRDCEGDPRFAVKIGLAILLDKAICLAIPKGMTPSKHLVKAADYVRYYTPGNQKELDDIGQLGTEIAKRRAMGIATIGLEKGNTRGIL